MKSAITPHSVTPKIFMKVFDSLVKPIILYIYPLFIEATVLIRYNERLKFSKSSDFVYSVVVSQRLAQTNSNNTYTFTNFSETVLCSLGLPMSAMINVPRNLRVKTFGKHFTRTCRLFYTNNIFQPSMNEKLRDNIMPTTNFIYIV